MNSQAPVRRIAPMFAKRLGDMALWRARQREISVQLQRQFVSRTRYPEDDENEAPKANKIDNQWLLVNDETLDLGDRTKAHKVIETLTQLHASHPTWVFDVSIVASYSTVGAKSIRKTLNYLVDNGVIQRTPQAEHVETSPGVCVKNTFHYFSLSSDIDQCIPKMPEDARWECALVHGRSEKRPANTSAHKKGELNNKKKHLEVLTARLKELTEEIAQLEESVNEESLTSTAEKIKQEQKQPVKIDTAKLAALIGEDESKGSDETEAPKMSIDDRLLMVRHRGAHK